MDRKLLASPGWTVQLLGRFDAQVGPGHCVAPPGRRVEELLCYLLLFRRRPHHREVLAGALWPESTTSQSRKYLRQSLWHLRSLGTCPDAVQLVRYQSEWIQVDESSLWLDVAQLEAAFTPVKLVAGEDLDEEQAAALKRVVPLYRGDLLEGCYHDWCVYERERLKAMYLNLLEKILGYCEVHAEPEEGVEYGEELLRHERAHERAHWRLMRLHYLAGNRTAALRQFGRCSTAMREELQACPGERIRTLHDQIRAGVALPLPPVSGPGAPVPPPVDAASSPGDPLQQALAALALSRRLLEESIRALRQAGVAYSFLEEGNQV